MWRMQPEYCFEGDVAVMRSTPSSDKLQLQVTAGGKQLRTVITSLLRRCTGFVCAALICTVLGGGASYAEEVIITPPESYINQQFSTINYWGKDVKIDGDLIMDIDNETASRSLTWALQKWDGQKLTVTGDTALTVKVFDSDTSHNPFTSYGTGDALFEGDAVMKVDNVIMGVDRHFPAYAYGVLVYEVSGSTEESTATFRKNLTVDLSDGSGNKGMTLYSSNKDIRPTLVVEGNAKVDVCDALIYNYGITTDGAASYYRHGQPGSTYAGHYDFRGGLEITAHGGDSAIGLKLTDLSGNKSENNKIINVEGKTTITASGAELTDMLKGYPLNLPACSNYGIYMYNIGAATFNDAEITTNAMNSDDASSYGIYVINSNAEFTGNVELRTSALNEEKEFSAVAQQNSNLTFAGGLESHGDGNDNVKNSLYADSSNITAKATAQNGISLEGSVNARNGSRIVLDQGDGEMHLYGDIISTASEISLGAENSSGVSQVLGQLRVSDSGSVEGVFTGKDSYYENVNDMGGGTGTINLSFSDYAQWRMKGSSEVSALALDAGGTLDMAYGNVGDAFGSYRTLTASSLSGRDGVILMNIDAGANVENSDRIYITGTHDGEHHIVLNNVNRASLTDGANGTVLVSVGDERGRFSVLPTEGKLYWNKYLLEAKDSTTAGFNMDWYLKEEIQEEEGPTGETTTTVEAGFSTNALGYHTWRAEMDSLMQRMGDLHRENEPSNGAWFRAKGGKIGRDDAFGFENKYVMYQLGYDDVLKHTDKYTSYIGAAFSYTDGDGSYNRGDGDNEGKEFGIYYTQIHKSGHYLDVAVKAGRWDNEFDVFDRSGDRISGSYDNDSIAFSAEYGRKVLMGAKGWYIEPQAQLRWGYFSGTNYTMSNGVSVRQSGISSLLGRVGFNIGRDIGKHGNIYVKANLYHEFCGDYSIYMHDDAGNSYQRSDVFDDTWFEYGIGAAFKWGDGARFYIDAERSAGGDYEKEWTINAGLAWTF